MDTPHNKDVFPYHHKHYRAHERLLCAFVLVFPAILLYKYKPLLYPRVDSLIAILGIEP